MILTKTKRVRLATLGLLTLALLSISMLAQAAPIWRYPGHMCRTNGYAGNDTSLDPLSYANALKNQSSSTRTVMCPMITQQYNGTPFEQASISMTNVSGSCRIYFRNISRSSGGWWSADEQGESPNPGWDPHFYWGEPGYYFNCVNRTCSFYCEVPGKTTIDDYQWSPN